MFFLRVFQTLTSAFWIIILMSLPPPRHLLKTVKIAQLQKLIAVQQTMKH